MAEGNGGGRDPAARRFALLQLVRLGGVALALAGALILAGRWDAPQALGAVLLLAGALDFFFVPRYLARQWRSPEE